MDKPVVTEPEINKDSRKNTSIRFILNDGGVTARGVTSTDTLLDWLRLERKLTGSKEGCAEGDCGACTVLVGRLNGDGQLVYETVNSCIRLVGSLAACHVVTIEYLKAQTGELHPVQQAMVDCHGSQCGFCTPGIVMSLYALWLSDETITRETICRYLQGNLCRCTGYDSIIKAGLKLAESKQDAANDSLIKNRDQIRERLASLAKTDAVTSEGDIHSPRSKRELLELMDRLEAPTIVSGSTDVGLWVTKQMRDLSPAIFINQVRELQTIKENYEGLTLGAGVTYSEARPAITRQFSELANFWDRIGGEQVRNMGTIGGNIANGSPIGDTPPAFIPLGATLTLESVSGSRTIALEDFFIEYGRQDRAANEIVSSIILPRKPEDALYRVYKISKRRDEDISAVCAGFLLTLESGIVTAARIAFGGMAGTPARARNAESALLGKPWSLETAKEAAKLMGQDFTPLSDWRASAAYRLKIAENLLIRFCMETSGESDQPASIDQMIADAREDA